MSRPTPPVIRVLTAGAALTLTAVGCAKDEPPPSASATPMTTANPPPPEEAAPPPPPIPMPTGNPPPPEVAAPTSTEGSDATGDAQKQPSQEASDGSEAQEAPSLPTWAEVGSGHPERATNPPRPVLAVTEDGRCFKEWHAGMLPPDPEVLAIGGRVIRGPDDTKGTEVQCPPQARQVLEAHAARTTPPTTEGE